MFMIFSFYDWLFSTNGFLPIVNLNRFRQSIQGVGAMSDLSEISIISTSIFCLLFPFSTFAGIFPQFFFPYLFTFITSVCYFLFSGFSSILSSDGNIVISDPVSIVKSLFNVFIFTVAVYCSIIFRMSFFLWGVYPCVICLINRLTVGICLRKVFSVFECI